MDNTLDKQPLRYPGQSLQEKLSRKLEDTAIAMGVLAGLFIGALFTSILFQFEPQLANPWFIIPISLLPLITFVHLTLRSHRNLKSHWKGLRGEQIVGETLNHFISGPDSFVFHDLVFDRYNIDHLIVSTRGVFVIETKAVYNDTAKEDQKEIHVYDDRVEIGGAVHRSHIEQAVRNASTIGHLLSKLGFAGIIPKPVLLYPGRYIHSHGSTVLARNQTSFPTHFRKLDPALDQQTVDQIHAALDRHLRVPAGAGAAMTST